MNIGSPTQKTDFTLDVFGRYICNTFEEALASSDAAFRAGATDTNGNPLPPRGDLRPFDYIIIGGGTFGSAVAEHIWNRTGSRSERILVLEGGPFALPEHVQNLPMMKTSELWGLPWNSDQQNLLFQGLAYCLGGRSVFWGGWSPRLLDSELPTSVWPKPVVDDLNAAYFRQSGEQIGVTETNDFVFGDLHHALRTQLFKAINNSSISDAIPLNELPDAPPVEILPAPPTIDELAELLGVKLTNPPPAAADLRNEVKLEAPLAVQGRGAHSGFFPMNKFSAVPLLIRAARGAFNESPTDDVRKRLMVVPRCHVSSLSVATDGTGRRVDGINSERGFISIPPDTKVIIALGTIESTRLALLSFGSDGRIGTNLMAHLRSNVDMRVPRAALAALLPTVNALQSSALLLKGQHKFTRPDGTEDGTLGHFHLQITASGLGSAGVDSEAELFQKLPDIDGLEQHLQATDTHVVITIRGIGEMQPGNPNSNVTLDLNSDQQDYGARKAWVNLVPTAKDNQLWDAMDKASDDVAHAFGGGLDFEVFTPQGIKTAKPAVGGAPRTDLKALFPYTAKNNPIPQNGGRRDALGTTHHEAGTLRMGTDPTKSVSNADCRFHDVKNAYVVGPALFPTIGSPNPMLTGIALARRLGDHLVPPPNPASAEAGFIYLFDGTQKPATFFTDWLMAEMPGGGNRFVIVGRSLIAQPGNGIGLLYYTGKQFNNFTLRLDFCLPHPRGGFNDNSGVFVRFRDPRKPVLPGTPGPDVPGNLATVAVDTGYEIQIDEEARGDMRKNEADGLFFNRTGAIYKIKTQGTAAGQQNYTNNQPLASGVWHSYEIKVTDRTYEVRLNGKPSTVFTANAADPNEKFRGRKKSEDGDSGFIGLQVHTGTVAFANIRITP